MFFLFFSNFTQALKYILCGNTPELEVLHLLFRHPKSIFFFNDFYLDEVLNKNPMARLEEFVHTNGCLTLISGLKLFSARPKLKTRKSQFKTKRYIMMKNLALGCAFYALRKIAILRSTCQLLHLGARL